MSNRDQFPKLKHGLYVNGVKVEDLDGYYYNNANVGIPDGCYSDGEPMSQLGSASFIAYHEFTAYGIAGSPLLEGSATMTAGYSFSAYGVTTDPPPAVTGSATMVMNVKFEAYGVAVDPPSVFTTGISVNVSVNVDVGQRHFDLWGNYMSYPFELSVPVKLEVGE